MEYLAIQTVFAVVSYPANIMVLPVGEQSRFERNDTDIVSPDLGDNFFIGQSPIWSQSRIGLDWS